MTALKKQLKAIEDRLHHHGVSCFEIKLLSRQGANLEIKNAKRDVYEVKEGLSYCIRILKDNRLASVHGTDLSRVALDVAIGNALESLPLLRPTPDFDFYAGGEDLQVDKELFCDADFSRITYDQKWDWLCALEEQALKVDKRIIQTQLCGIEDEIETVALSNSLGLERESQRSLYYTHLGLLAKEGDSEQSYYATSAKNRFQDCDQNELIERVCPHVLELLGAQTVKSYEGSVVVLNTVMAELLEFLSESFYGDRILKKQSCLSDQLGQSFYSPHVNLVDDGLLPNGVGSSAFDAEGVPQVQTSLVSQGVVKGYLYDRFWAHQAHQESTGNCFQENLTVAPQISHSGLYLQPGELSHSELLEKLGEGLVITDVMGIHMGDPVSGDFSVGIQGILLKCSGYHKAIKGMLFCDNIHRILKHVQAVGSDVVFEGRVGAPSVLLGPVSVRGD